MTAKEARRYLRISKVTLSKWAKLGRIKKYTLSKIIVRYSQKDILHIGMGVSIK
ncbi:MAG: helix-turn-helix domain-containing protein [Patescibacteria group bacterium]|nr:helix-turn-helix domain-containing protein [Patescibacteria group bacterium]